MKRVAFIASACVCLAARVVVVALGVSMLTFNAAAQEPRRGGVAVVTHNVIPTSLLNQIDQGASAFSLGARFLEPLVGVDDKWQFAPKLATAWVQAPDGKKWTFTLRDGVKWHDGKPFSANDVKWNFENVWSKVWKLEAVTAISEVRVTGELSVDFILAQAIAPEVFLATLSQRLFLLAPQGFVGTPLRESPQNQKPTGTGPFRVKEFVSGQYVVLERNPEYWDKGKPYLDQLVFRFLPDPDSRAAAVRSGEAVLSPIGGLPLAETTAAKKDSKLVVSSKGLEGYVWSWGLTFNMLKVPLSNEKVRHAIAHAIDKRKIADLIFLGYAKPQHSALPEGVKYHAADTKRYELDVALANRMLDEAGYPRGRDGQRFSLKYIGSGGQIGIFQRTGQYVTQALKELGIGVSIEVPDSSTYLRRVYKDRDFDIDLFNSVFVLDPCISTVGWYTSEAFRSGAYFRNHSGLQDADVDAAAERGCVAADPGERADAFMTFQRLTNASLSILPLVQEERPNIYSTKLKNVGAGSVNWYYDSWADLWLSQ
jgi:peptide/nickel transport system substrate-binding protein